jgi:hypothetical protein
MQNNPGSTVFASQSDGNFDAQVIGIYGRSSK